MTWLKDSNTHLNKPNEGERAISEWIKIEDRQPEDERAVLFVVARHNEVCVGYKPNVSESMWLDMLNTMADGDPCDEYNATHWMPLPEPPIP